MGLRRRDRIAPDPQLPPAILVGGSANAMSVTHSLGHRGIRVYLLCPPGAEPAYSRFATRLDVAPRSDAWLEFLLGERSDRLRGAVLLACSDDGVEMLLEHREALAEKYLLDICEPAAQSCFLNKLCTYEAAREAGVPTPLFWRADRIEDVHAHEEEFVYPLIVKPLFSHRFKKVFTGKYFVARDFDELLEAFGKVHEHGVEALLVEEIPGDDDRLCSMFTYLDDEGEPLFEFTKRVIRRYPEHQGFGCYHITDWDAEVWETGLRLVRHVGLRGLANVEFKRDHRDGKLKVMECNIRFTAANQNLVAAGYDLPLFVYGRLVGRPRIDLRDKAVRQERPSVVPHGRPLRLPRLAPPGQADGAVVADQHPAPPEPAVLPLGRSAAVARDPAAESRAHREGRGAAVLGGRRRARLARETGRGPLTARPGAGRRAAGKGL